MINHQIYKDSYRICMSSSVYYIIYKQLVHIYIYIYILLKLSNVEILGFGNEELSFAQLFLIYFYF